MSRTILLVDDDEGLGEMVTYNLQQYSYQVTTITNGRRGFEVARDTKPDLIILDVMLPEMNGFEICRRLRLEESTATIPIIMLTAKRYEVDKVTGLETGADDYLVKPFGARELLARVHAVLRRSNQKPALKKTDLSQENLRIVAGPLSIDLIGWRISCRGKEIELQPKEFALLTYLVRNRGTVLTRTQLLDNVWGENYEGGTRTVDVHIRWLREKIEENPAEPKLIQTVLRVGYCFR